MSSEELTPAHIESGMLFCDRYLVERHIDEGGMATIYLATDEETGQRVALKVLFDRYTDNEVIRARFLDEGRIQAMLDHPNVVHVHRVISEPVLSFVMEYVEGTTLDEYLQDNAPLAEAEIVELMLPVLSAVGFAHNKGIVHRDLKPSNVLLNESADGFLEPKVMDFGVAKVDRGRDLTADGTTVGTLHYMSPEQIVGSRDIDGRADIYSLGCSLYKLCTGEVPFNASSEFALMMAQVEAPPTPPSELREGLSEPMEEIILKALEKEPEHRFQTIKQMTSQLMELTESKDERDTTITRPLPAELIDFALDADEVIVDRTDELRLAPMPEPEEPDEGAQGRTKTLSSTALQRIESDRLRAARRKSGTTRPLNEEDVETAVSPPPPDPEAPTTERDRPESITRPNPKFDPMENEPTTEQQPTEADEDRPARGVIAVDNPHVDSKEVTDLHEKNSLEQRETDERTSPDERTPSGERIPADEGGPRESASDPGKQQPDSHRITAAERPASKTGGESEGPAEDRFGNSMELTSDQAERFSETARKILAGDSSTSAENQSRQRGSDAGSSMPSMELERPATNGGGDGVETETASGDSAPDPRSREGMIWIGIGITALVLAFAVLIWAIFSG